MCFGLRRVINNLENRIARRFGGDLFLIMWILKDENVKSVDIYFNIILSNISFLEVQTCLKKNL